MADLKAITELVVKGKVADVAKETQAAIDEGVAPLEIINDGLLPGMDEVGALFKAAKMFVPQVLMSAKAMGAGMDLVKPLLEGASEAAGTVVIGTVKGDLHDIGKNLLVMMLESAGFEIYNLGKDVPTKDFIAKAKEVDADIIGMSALLTTTMPAMKEGVELAKEAGLRAKVIVGGAPISHEFAESIGAYGFAPDAAEAVDLFKEVCAK